MKKDTTNNDLAITIGVMSSTMARVENDIKEIKATLAKDVATKEWVKDNYETSKKLVYGMVTLLLTAAVLAIIKLVFIK